MGGEKEDTEVRRSYKAGSAAGERRAGRSGMGARDVCGEERGKEEEE